MYPRLVYDAGMNNGDDTANYLSRGFDVVAIETDRASINAAAGRFANDINQGRLTLVNAAVGAERGEDMFYFSEGNRGVWNSLSPNITGRDGIPTRAVVTQCMSFQEVLQQHGVPYYLKIDIEGVDHFAWKRYRQTRLPAPGTASRMPPTHGSMWQRLVIAGIGMMCTRHGDA